MNQRWAREPALGQRTSSEAAALLSPTATFSWSTFQDLSEACCWLYQRSFLTPRQYSQRFSSTIIPSNMSFQKFAIFKTFAPFSETKEIQCGRQSMVHLRKTARNYQLRRKLANIENPGVPLTNDCLKNQKRS